MAESGRRLSFLLLTLILLSSEVASQTPSTDDKQILLRIKQDWGDPVLDSWSDTAGASPNSTSHCSWPGVGCAAGGSVVNISLNGSSGPKIGRPIPDSLCNLKNLTLLNLGYNNIPGPFPVSLYDCAALQYLDLQQNRFVGVIPDDVYRLSPLLTHLDLNSNSITGDIPASIGRLPAVQTLSLYNNLFNGTFPKEIGNLSTLQVLFLAYNSFSPMSIPAEFGNLTKLTFLWMTSTNVIGDIPESFSNLKAMIQLDLSINSLTGKIPAGIWALPNLNYLYIYKNKLSGSITIEGTIGARRLKEIDVSKNQLTGSIPEDFGKLQNLSVLFMYFNQLSGKIPADIGLIPSLSDLRLFGNSLTGVLPPELGKHSPLLNVEICDNELSGEVPDGLCDTGELVSVVVFNNSMSGSIPPSLGKCPKLNNLQLYGNRFSGDLPQGIWSAINLTTVLIRDNELSGELPDKLPWNLTRLEMQNNRFSGRVPSSADGLKVFIASNNDFSGDLPASLAGYSRLQTLNLGGNNITGRIPSDLTPLKFLTELNLRGNRLVGDIPASIGSLPVLNSLDLSSNELSGLIPAAMDNLKLNVLNLSSNKLSGVIPAGLQSAAYENSFLSNPGLCAGPNSHLNVAACRSGSGKSDGLARGLLILLCVLGAVVFLMAVAFAACVYRDHRRRKRGGGEDPANWKLTSFQSLDFTESSILRGMTEENVIGSGGAGKVYKVTLGDRAGEVVAVKKIWSSRKLNSRLEKGFQSEVEILGSIKHINVVKLLCCISGTDAKLLVYEYMENGSLDRWLHGKQWPPAERAAVGEPGSRLDWARRLEIAIGAARGLCYMHHQCSPPVIHRDVKSSNILLDSEFNARIADFGLARLVVRQGEAESVSAIAGSFGYMAPECGYSRRLTEKVDVYSFGVVLLELTTGREANNDGEPCNLAEWAWRWLQEGMAPLGDVVDPALRDSAYTNDIATVLKLGLLCTETLPSRRPSMKDVLQILQSCNRPVPPAATTGGDGCKPRADEQRHAAPLLFKTKSGGQRKKSSSFDGDDCNV